MRLIIFERGEAVPDHYQLVSDVFVKHRLRDLASDILSMPQLRSFLASHGRGYDLHRMTDQAVLDEVLREFQSGRLKLAEELPSHPLAYFSKKKGSSAAEEVGPATTWVEFQVVWADGGQGVEGVEFTVRLPGNREQTAGTNTQGIIRIDGLAPGNCDLKTSLRDVTLANAVVLASASAPKSSSPSNTAPPPGNTFHLIDVEPHKVKKGETLASIARKADISWQHLALFNWGTYDPGKINRHLFSSVGCRKKTKDGNNYVFDDADKPGIVYVPKKWSRVSLATNQRHVLQVNRAGPDRKKLLVLWGGPVWGDSSDVHASWGGYIDDVVKKMDQESIVETNEDIVWLVYSPGDTPGVSRSLCELDTVGLFKQKAAQHSRQTPITVQAIENVLALRKYLESQPADAVSRLLYAGCSAQANSTPAQAACWNDSLATEEASPNSNKPIAERSITEKLGEVFRRMGPMVGPEVKEKLDQLVSKESVAMMAAFLGAWAIGHLFGVGEILDILAAIGLLCLGQEAISAASDIYEFASGTINATSEAELDQAAHHGARAIATIGVDTFVALLTHQTAKVFGEVIPPRGPMEPPPSLTSAGAGAGAGGGGILSFPVAASSVRAGTPALVARSGVVLAVAAKNGGGGSKPPKGPADTRIKLRKQTRADIEAAQPRNAAGKMIDPNTKQPLKPGEIDVGHKPGQEWRLRKELHKRKGSTRAEVIEAENDPNLYHLENNSSNRSHKFEKK